MFIKRILITFTMTKITQTRLKVVLFFGTIISILCAVAMFKNMESVALVLGGAIAGVAAKYTHDETKRKSDNKI